MADSEQHRAKLQQLVEFLKIIKKLYANDPKAMAKALAGVFKQLRQAVDDYKSADDTDFDGMRTP